MSVDDGVGVCFPRGFRAAGVTCGIKASGAPDLALVACDGAARRAAGAFTRSRLAAAPVVLSREHLADGRARAVVVNSGNANACTGARGMQDARAMAAATARALGIAPERGRRLLDRRDRQAAADRGDRAGHRAGRRRALAERRRRRRRRHPHHRRLGQDEHRHLRAQRRRGAHRRDGQGRGHDPARRRDDHRDRDHRCGRRARRARRAAARRRRCVAQPRLGGRLGVDERHARRARERRKRRDGERRRRRGRSAAR